MGEYKSMTKEHIALVDECAKAWLEGEKLGEEILEIIRTSKEGLI